MTNQEIYNQVVWNVFGDSDVIPPSINANMFGVSGLLSRAHKFMQSNTDWWFMRSVHTEAISGEIELDSATAIGSAIVVVDETDLLVDMLAYGDNYSKWSKILSLGPCTLTEPCLATSASVVLSAASVAGNPVLTMASEVGLSVGMLASGTNLASGSLIISLAPCTLDRNALVTGTQSITFYSPTTVKFYQSQIAVPADFKRDITMRIRYSNGSVQLVKRAPSIVMDKYMDSNDLRETQPTYYFIRNDTLYFCGTPTSAGTMMLDYYRYLPYPVAIGADDDVLIELAEPMIYYCSMMIASLLQDMNKLQIFTTFYDQTLSAARLKNFNRTANFDEFRVAQLW